MLICHQCEQEIDTTKLYALGGEPGLMGGPKPPSHLGACETMPVFVMLEPPARIVKASPRFELLSRNSQKARAL